ncbi:hypothetical protein ARMSODRAFT_978762 [Armillaria solidipes]|uniref:Uncharacterized protein n=1 Tax=Armillaria solidipes TaxID=1076256 RepID=A0A2H3BCN7_9AGAR|nr:hypothetical protein ARMSODRAFT_978762 [Armillaria solidipes]
MAIMPDTLLSGRITGNAVTDNDNDNNVHPQWQSEMLGRPCKYHSEDEKKEAHADNQARYYHWCIAAEHGGSSLSNLPSRHKERLNEEMRTRYHASKPPDVRTRRCGPREKMVVIPTKMPLPKKTTLSTRMLRRIKLYDGQLHAMTTNSVPTYLHRLCERYLVGRQGGSAEEIDQAVGALEDLLGKAQSDLDAMYEDGGIDAAFWEGEDCVNRIRLALQASQDLSCNAMLGQREVEWLRNQRLLMYQTAY